MVRNAPRFNDEQANEIRKKYDAGGTVDGLAVEYGTTGSTVCRTIRRIGGTVRTMDYKKTQFDDDIAKKMREAYEGGATIYKLAEEYGTTPSTVSRTIKRVGGEIRPPLARSNKGKKHKKSRKKPGKGILSWLDS